MVIGGFDDLVVMQWGFGGSRVEQSKRMNGRLVWSGLLSGWKLTFLLCCACCYDDDVALPCFSVLGCSHAGACVAMISGVA